MVASWLQLLVKESSSVHSLSSPCSPLKPRQHRLRFARGRSQDWKGEEGGIGKCWMQDWKGEEAGLESGGDWKATPYSSAREIGGGGEIGRGQRWRDDFPRRGDWHAPRGKILRGSGTTKPGKDVGAAGSQGLH